MKVIKKLELWSWVYAIIGLLAVILSLWISGKLSSSLAMIFYVLAWISLLAFNILGTAFGIISLVKLSNKKKSTEKIHAIAGIISNIIVFFSLLSLMIFGLISE